MTSSADSSAAASATDAAADSAGAVSEDEDEHPVRDAIKRTDSVIDNKLLLFILLWPPFK